MFLGRARTFVFLASRSSTFNLTVHTGSSLPALSKVHWYAVGWEAAEEALLRCLFLSWRRWECSRWRSGSSRAIHCARRAEAVLCFCCRGWSSGLEKASRWKQKFRIRLGHLSNYLQQQQKLQAQRTTTAMATFACFTDFGLYQCCSVP